MYLIKGGCALISTLTADCYWIERGKTRNTMISQDATSVIQVKDDGRNSMIVIE